jgi:hypothetical protein
MGITIPNLGSMVLMQIKLVHVLVLVWAKYSVHVNFGAIQVTNILILIGCLRYATDHTTVYDATKYSVQVNFDVI